MLATEWMNLLENLRLMVLIQKLYFCSVCLTKSKDLNLFTKLKRGRTCESACTRKNPRIYFRLTDQRAVVTSSDVAETLQRNYRSEKLHLLTIRCVFSREPL